MKIFSGTSNIELSKKIAKLAGVPLGKIDLETFSDGELRVAFKENIRGENVFLIQSTNPPAENLFQLLLMLDAAKRASAKTVTAVIPYYGYSRQDRKDQPRVPISARMIMDLMSAAGVDRMITMDLHSPQIQGFTNVPFDNLYSRIILFNQLKGFNLDFNNGVVLAPDIGSAKMSQSYAKKLGIGFALIDKRRPKHNVAEVVNLIGELKNKHVFIIDDMIDTAGTLTKSAQLFMDHGAKSVSACCTHALLSGPAHERIENSVLKELVVTNTIQLKKQNSKIKVLEIADLFSDVMKQHINYKSISKHFVFAN